MTFTKNARMATRRARPFRRESILNENANVPFAFMVSFLFEFAHSKYPPVPLVPAFRMQSTFHPRIQPGHIPSRKRHQTSLLGVDRLVVRVLLGPVAVMLGVCRHLDPVTSLVDSGVVGWFTRVGRFYFCSRRT